MKSLIFLVALLSLGCSPSGTPNASATQVAGPTSSATPVAAPNLVAIDQDGQKVDFSQLYAKGPLVVYFYPKADTPGCTAQSCSLRDAYAKIQDAGLTVVGVSTDQAAAQKAFKDKYKLPFTLIADPSGDVLKAFGVPQMLGHANREAFLIRSGKIVWHDNHASTAKQADDILLQVQSWK